MELFRFWKVGQKKGVWKPYVLRLESEVIANEHSAFTTVLAVNSNPGRDEAVPDDALYSGPFYIDIDSDSIKKSIAAATRIYNKLLKNKVPANCIRIFATGKRGFHFEIPQGCFCKEEGVFKLPRIYWHMAAALKLPEETDMTVYSGGKGRMWRLPNKKRDDNGKFKVQITPTELLDMTEENYAEVTASPRETWNAEVSTVPFLKSLFEVAKTRAMKADKPKAVFIDPEMHKLLEDKLPPCAEMMRTSTDLKRGIGFNSLSVQFAKAVVAFAPSDARDLVTEFAENAHGDNYNTPKKRRDHCLTAVKIASKNKHYQWSCKSALSVLGSEPCLECPIAHIRMQQEEESHQPKPVKSNGAHAPLPAELSPEAQEEFKKAASQSQALREQEEAAEEQQEADQYVEGEPQSEQEGTGPDEGLMVTDEGYGFMTADGHMRRICNFTLNLISHYVQWVEALKADRRVAVMAEITIAGKVVGKAVIEESNWNSKSSLISCLGGISNVAFYGKDDDVQRMKSSLMADIEKSTTQIRRVTSCGIHRTEVNGEYVFTYVEPGWSIDQFGNEDRFYLVGTPNGFPRLKNVRLPEEQEDKDLLTEVLSSLIQMNRPETMAQLLGWYCACFLKQHIMVYRNEFPLLSAFGNRGSGKSTTTALLAALHGVNYVLEHSPISMPSASNFAVWNTIATSMTIPRIMEEYNKSKLKGSKYDEFGEYFKDCWNSYAIVRGTLSSNRGAGANPLGVESHQYPLTGPVVICSEQGIMMPALVQRTVQVGMSEQDLDTVPMAREHGSKVRSNHQRLWQFAKAAYMYALELTPAEINKWVEKYNDLVPIQIGDRPHYSYRVVLMGLDYMRFVCEGVGLNCLDLIDNLKEVLVQQLKTDILAIATAKRRTEIDIIMTKLATMAALSQKDSGTPWLMPGQHYFKTPDHLYLDGLVCHALYVRYMNQVERTPPVVEDYAQMKPLLKSEAYCLSMAAFVQDFCNNKPVIKLDLRRMAEKGIEVDAFMLTGEPE